VKLDRGTVLSAEATEPNAINPKNALTTTNKIAFFITSSPMDEIGIKTF
jgi:hypothetical protein